MIVTNIIGGLGNQMFQYAFGRALSLRFGVPLKIDVYDFRKYTLHTGFLLKKIFSLPAQEATGRDRREILGWRGHLPVLKLLTRQTFERWCGKNLLLQDITQPAARFIAAASANSYLIGYWQSENYFAPVADQIRLDFKFLPMLSGLNDELAERIRNCRAVSLHVRRGDYANNPRTQSVHGLCSLDYYHRAIAYISKQFAESEFFVFSDDLDWARKHLRIPHPVHFVDGNGSRNSFHDMHLMSLCKHHIIANSSFSWWGAWLSAYAGKIVVAPARWLAEIILPDVVPDRWIRL